MSRDSAAAICPDVASRGKMQSFAASASTQRCGAISLYPIDGIGSEVAIMAYLSNDRLLWASDFIQTVDGPTSYATEVWRAVHRDGLHPERTAAEHLSLTPWSKIEELQASDRTSGDSSSK